MTKLLKGEITCMGGKKIITSRYFQENIRVTTKN